MEYATCPASAHAAPERCATRAHRLGKVKFVALVLEPEPAPVETVSPPPARLYRALRAFLSRVCERLVAARP